MLDKIKELFLLMKIPIEKARIKKSRLSWDETFLYQAYIASFRSHDAQTQCGCVLARDNTILSTGYNGYVRGLYDDVLPNVRPWKYDFMVHAEHNAILNCARNGISTLGATAYITGEPCNWCLQYMWQVGITRIIYSNFSDVNMVKNDEFKAKQELLLLLMKPKNLTLNFIDKQKILEKVSEFGV